MVSITADEKRLLREVGLFMEPVEVHDTEGNLLGYFVPANLQPTAEPCARPVNLADRPELERRLRANEPGEPYEVVRPRLLALEAEIQRREAAGEAPFSPEEGVKFFRQLRSAGQPSDRNNPPDSGPGND
jgi:hypothetical protein